MVYHSVMRIFAKDVLDAFDVLFQVFVHLSPLNNSVLVSCRGFRHALRGSRVHAMDACVGRNINFSGFVVCEAHDKKKGQSNHLNPCKGSSSEPHTMVAADDFHYFREMARVSTREPWEDCRRSTMAKTLHGETGASSSTDGTSRSPRALGTGERRPYARPDQGIIGSPGVMQHEPHDSEDPQFEEK